MIYFDEEPELDDDQARAALEHLLKVRRKPPPESVSRREAIEASMWAAELLRGIFGSHARAAGVMLPFEAYQSLPAVEQRRLLVETLRLGLPIMQPGASIPLAEALLALNGGQVRPLVKPADVGRRRIGPYDMADVEMDALRWVQWQRGLGRKAKDAEQDVADALGVSLAAMKKWPPALAKVFGVEHVRRRLALALAAGKAELESQQRISDIVAFFASDHDGYVDYCCAAAANPLSAHPDTGEELLFPMPEPGPFFPATDEGYELWSTWATLPRDLDDIAARRKAAMGKRTAPKAAHRKRGPEPSRR